MTLRRVVISALAVVAGLSGSVVAGAPAQAASKYGCNYPRVCFYKTNLDLDARVVTAAYQDVTPGWQILGNGGKGSMWVYNSRNDDVVYLFYTENGANNTKCVSPSGLSVFAKTQIVTKVKISSSSTC